MADTSTFLVEELPVLHRLALSYAPTVARAPTLALLALDTRLAAILRAAREPMLAQLRLAWWREQLGAEKAVPPGGDPLLTALESWGGRRSALGGLVEGWEAMTGAAPLRPQALSGFAQARGQAFADLADVLGEEDDREEARRLGTDWALADMTGHLGDPEERRHVVSMVAERGTGAARLSRRMRPLVVLHGLAGERPETPLALLKAMRLGLLGR